MRCEHEHDDGAYVLGALSPAERAAYERHLATCSFCREAVADIAVLPGLLGRLDPADFAKLLDPTCRRRRARRDRHARPGHRPRSRRAARGAHAGSACGCSARRWPRPCLALVVGVGAVFWMDARTPAGRRRARPDGGDDAGRQRGAGRPPRINLAGAPAAPRST